MKSSCGEKFEPKVKLATSSDDVICLSVKTYSGRALSKSVGKIHVKSLFIRCKMLAFQNKNHLCSKFGVACCSINKTVLNSKHYFSVFNRIFKFY